MQSNTPLKACSNYYLLLVKYNTLIGNCKTKGILVVAVSSDVQLPFNSALPIHMVPLFKIPLFHFLHQ